MVGLLVGAPSVALAGAAEDDRATQVEGNVTGADCAQLWPGSTEVELTDVVIDETNTYLTVKGVPEGVTVAGIVVKGGPRYNKYDVEDLGELHWFDLRSPNNASGGPAQISHWFACGTSTTVTTTPTTTTTTTTTTTSSTTTTSPTSSETTTSGPSVTPSSPATTAPTTTTAAVSPGSNDDDLASTGANVGWLLLTGLLLLAGGAVLVMSPAVRAALARR